MFLLVNILGTLIYFVSVKLLWNDITWSQSFLRFGILGSLTTFSSFSFEVAHSVKTGQPIQACAIFGLNILAGVLIAIGVLR
jgi:fluoride ion exporter CrcB/FEX